MWIKKHFLMLMLNLTSFFFFLPVTISLLLLSSSSSSNTFLSSQLSLMYIAPSKRRHKINPLPSICTLQNHLASDQYTFRLDDKGNRCVCVSRLLCTEESFSTNKSGPLCVPVCVPDQFSSAWAWEVFGR